MNAETHGRYKRNAPFETKRGVDAFQTTDGEATYIASSIIARCARRIAFTFFIRRLTDGLVKNVRFLNSFKTPDRSYFFLNRRIARSIGSFSPIMMPTRLITSLGCSAC